MTISWTPMKSKPLGRGAKNPSQNPQHKQPKKKTKTGGRKKGQTSPAFKKGVLDPMGVAWSKGGGPLWREKSWKGKRLNNRQKDEGNNTEGGRRAEDWHLAKNNILPMMIQKKRTTGPGCAREGGRRSGPEGLLG